MTSSYMTLKEAAEYLRYTTAAFRKIVRRSRLLIEAGMEPEIQFRQPKVGGKILFRKEWLEDFIALPQPVPREPRKPSVQRPLSKWVVK